MSIVKMLVCDGCNDPENPNLTKGGIMFLVGGVGEDDIEDYDWRKLDSGKHLCQICRINQGVPVDSMNFITKK
ncbi:MAG: hypothetical protein ACFFDT_22680 [Candidatus Hodarchaeota archaeon]